MGEIKDPVFLGFELVKAAFVRVVVKLASLDQVGVLDL